MEARHWIELAYLAAAVLFILGLKGMTHPRTAVRGNLLASVGMLIAVVATLAHGDVVSYGLLGFGLALGTALGAVFALRVQMTDMPQLVALLNGSGGAASALVAGAGLMTVSDAAPPAQLMVMAGAAAVSGVIGALTFWGSLVAFGKLQELQAFRQPKVFPAHQLLNALLALAAVGCGVWNVLDPPNLWAYWGMCLFASALGVTLVLPIGGADMPVVIALLNSSTGLAAAGTGFILDNTVLIVSGSLVGASGFILMQIMCKAMNRSLFNVLFGGMESAGGAVASADDVYAGRIKSTSADEIAMLYDGAERAVIVPGYGMAVAQAQHAVRELMDLLEARGVQVEFAVHPVAGRMPGHMNVLLAEAEVPYDKLKEMDEINPTFAQTDVVLVIGANDVVNPAARTDPNSPIAGMPILNVDQAKTVVVVKRSLSPGFANIPNPLFAADNCLMYFADGKKAIVDLNTAIKEL